MSYDFSLLVDTGGREPLRWKVAKGVTHNLEPILSLAWDTEVTDLNGRWASDLISVFEEGLAALKDPARTYEFAALEDPSGFGTVEQAVTVTEKILAACKDHPRTRFECDP